MKVCRISFRATFSQPLGRLNPIGAKVPGEIEVEVYESKFHIWKFRRPETSYEFDIPQQSSAELARAAAEELFARQVVPWQMYGLKRRLEPWEVTERNERTYVLEPSDLTHVPDFKNPPKEKRLGRSMCGEELIHDRFIVRGAGVKPSCRACLAACPDFFKA